MTFGDQTVAQASFIPSDASKIVVSYTSDVRTPESTEDASMADCACSRATALRGLGWDRPSGRCDPYACSPRALGQRVRKLYGMGNAFAHAVVAKFSRTVLLVGHAMPARGSAIHGSATEAAAPAHPT